MGGKVSHELFMRVKDTSIFANDDHISFEESVSLMARQKKLKGSVGEADGCSFGHFAGIMKLRIVWVGHFT